MRNGLIVDCKLKWKMRRMKNRKRAKAIHHFCISNQVPYGIIALSAIIKNDNAYKYKHMTWNKDKQKKEKKYANDKNDNSIGREYRIHFGINVFPFFYSFRYHWMRNDGIFVAWYVRVKDKDTNSIETNMRWMFIRLMIAIELLSRNKS